MMGLLGKLRGHINSHNSSESPSRMSLDKKIRYLKSGRCKHPFLDMNAGRDFRAEYTCANCNKSFGSSATDYVFYNGHLVHRDFKEITEISEIICDWNQ